MKKKIMSLEEFKLQYSLGTITKEQKLELARSKCGVDPEIFEILSRETTKDGNDSYYHWITRGNSTIAEVVASNPSCPVNILRKLSKSKVTRERVARNPSSPPDLLTTIFLNCADCDNKKDCVAQQAVLKNPNCPSDILMRAAKHGDYNYDIAHNPNMPAEVAEVIFNHANRNPRNHGNEHVLIALAGNINTPAKLLTVLSQLPYGVNVRIASCSNPRCPLEIIVKSCKDRSKRLKQLVAYKIVSMIDVSRIQEIAKEPYVDALREASKN